MSIFGRRVLKIWGEVGFGQMVVASMENVKTAGGRVTVATKHAESSGYYVNEAFIVCLRIWSVFLYSIKQAVTLQQVGSLSTRYSDNCYHPTKREMELQKLIVTFLLGEIWNSRDY